MKKYFLHDGINQYGPFDMADLETKIITPQTLVWFESLPEWKPAGEIEELKDLLNRKVPASQILSPPVVKTKDEDWTKKMYYYSDEHGQQGPFTFEQLKSRPIKADTPVWYDPLPEWTTAEKVAGLKDIIAHHQQSASAHTTSAPQRSYYYMDSANKQQGPFTLEQLKQKPISVNTLIWYDGLAQWVQAGSDASVKEIISTSQPAAAASGNKKYYYLDSNNQQQGPFTFEQMKGKPITANTSVWYDGLAQWIPAGSDASLKEIIVSSSTSQAPAIASSDKKYYYLDSNNQQQGPFTLEQLKTKPLTTVTLVWYDGLPQWVQAGNEPSLKEVFYGSRPATLINQTKYYYLDNANQQQGPFTLDQLRGKPLTANTPVWYDGLPQWTTAAQVEALRGIIV